MLTVIELFKKSGEVLEKIDAQWKQRYPFAILGYYDFLAVRRVRKYEDIYGQGQAENCDGILSSCFSKYSLITFDIQDTVGKYNEDKLCDEMIEASPKSPFYMVISCILREGFYEFSNGYDAFNQVKKKVYDKLDGVNAELKKKSEPLLRYQLLGNLGVFDVTLIVASKNLKALHWVPSILRGVKIEDNGGPLISYSSSFLTYNIPRLAEFGKELEKEEHAIYNESKFGLSARMSLYDLRTEKALCYQLENDFLEICGSRDTTRIRKVNGEYDLTMFASDLTIGKLVKFLLHKYFNVFTTEYNECIRSIYALLSCEFDSFSLGSEEHWSEVLCSTDEWEDALKKKAEEKKPSETLDSLLDRQRAWRKVTKKKVRLERVWKEVKVPTEIQHKLEACANAAISLSRNNLEYPFGNFLINLLTSILEKARDSQKEIEKLTDPVEKEKKSGIWYVKFTGMIGNVSVMLPNIHPANRLLLDSVEHQDAVNSVIKVMIANRKIASDFFRYVGGYSEEFKKPFNRIFVTVGSGSNYYSNRFLWPELPEISDKEISDKNKIDNDKSSVFLSLNLPSERYMFLEQNMPIFLHELAHYVRLSESDRASRNEALHELLSTYCTMVITLTICGIPRSKKDFYELTSSAQKNISHIRSAFSSLVKNALKDDEGNSRWDKLMELHSEDFCVAWMEMLQSVLKEATERSTPYNDKFVKGIELLTTNTEFLKVFRDAAMEARCDMILLSWCRIGLGQGYKKSWYNCYFDVVRCHFVNQGRSPSSEDTSFRYRIAIIIGYFYIRKNRNSLADDCAYDNWEYDSDKFEKWLDDEFLRLLTDENIMFVKRYTSEVKADIALLLQFSVYLVDAEQYLNDNINAEVKKAGNDIAICIAKSACGTLMPYEELKLYLRSWYEVQQNYDNDED